MKEINERIYLIAGNSDKTGTNKNRFISKKGINGQDDADIASPEHVIDSLLL